MALNKKRNERIKPGSIYEYTGYDTWVCRKEHWLFNSQYDPLRSTFDECNLKKGELVMFLRKHPKERYWLFEILNGKNHQVWLNADAVFMLLEKN